MRREKGGATTAATTSYEKREGYYNSYDYIQLLPLLELTTHHI
jgi:hypothetical protein